MSLYDTMIRLGVLNTEPEDSMKRTTMVRATKETTRALRQIAADLGYVLTAGTLAGEGDVPAMLDAIARGELRIVPQNAVPPHQDVDRCDNAR